jgi:hypothetical protein
METLENEVVVEAQTTNSINLNGVIDIITAKQKLMVNLANAYNECKRADILETKQIAEKYTKSGKTDGHAKASFKKVSEWDLDENLMKIAKKQKAKYESLYQLSRDNNLADAIELVQSLMD